MRKCYHIYVDSYEYHTKYRLINGIKHWAGPIYDKEHLQTIQFYSRKDTEEAIEIFRSNGMKVFVKTASGYGKVSFAEYTAPIRK